MCTTNLTTIPLTGSASRAGGWLRIAKGVVACDHPLTLTCEHALLIDLWDGGDPHGARVSIELDVASAASLARTILTALADTRAEVQDGAGDPRETDWPNTSDLIVTGTVRDGSRTRPRST